MSPRPTPVAARRHAGGQTKSRPQTQPARANTAPSATTPSATTSATSRSATTPPATSRSASSRSATTSSSPSRSAKSRTRAAKTSATQPEPTATRRGIRSRRGVSQPNQSAHRRVVVGGAHRFAGRGLTRRLRSWKVLVSVLAVLGLVFGGGWLVYESSVLTVRQIDVLGTSRQSPASVRAALGSEMGRQVARVDLNSAARRVASLPAVKSVQVVRAWPAALEVRVVEREPLARITLADGTWMLDAEGVRMAKANIATKPGTKTPVDAAATTLPVVDPATATRSGAVAAVMASLEKMSPALRAQVKSARATTAHDVTFTLTSGATVVWGSAEQSAQKAEVLAVLMQIKAKTYDVSAPSAPVTR